jgi:dihydrofolate reductase
MRKLFSFNMMTLDGFFQGQNHDLNWHNVDEEFNTFALNQLEEVDTLLFGRVTYQGMAAYWPTAPPDDPVAEIMNSRDKIVVTRTLKRAEWNNTKIIGRDAIAEIAQLKQQPGKVIAVFGSADLLSTLMQADLVDEHRIMLNPVSLGGGSPLFKEGAMSDLKLLEARPFASGNVLLRYRPAS